MPETSLDDADLDLVAALQVAPRAPLSALADVLGSSASTVGRRLARLADERLLRVIGQVEWPMLAEGTPMHIWVATDPGQARTVAGRLAELPEVPFVATTTGRADVYCSLHATRRAGARELLMSRIPSVPGVRSARTELVLRASTKSDSWRLRRLGDDQLRALREVAEPLNEPADPADPATVADFSTEELGAVELLRHDGRASAAEVARALGISRSTAYRLTQSLLRRGLVRPRVEIEPALLGYALEVVVELHAAPGAIQQVADALARHPSARYVSIVAGTSSVIHHGVFRNEEGLAEFLTHDLAAFPGITACEVSVMLDVLRRYWIGREDGRLMIAG
ncbi:Lrp/AsnC family transcriptional regulator [Streptomyces botrytidirepellens]|uniref:Lrp/AsnC family transcriptional regulator n=1 Tax=Streptomyces botrytidirepellens TaxID=2486417 RepID=A0A3M8VPH8_9ACTN|nr:Lrp/AsnC family transcriptional regulator [Streptomyces botrytidirepellens]RNG19608.1 Lrp/AsnC family transcriptional regulator [Streptomyces botrytidirepellens]